MTSDRQILSKAIGMKIEFDEEMETATRNGAYGKSFRGYKEEKSIQEELAVLADKGVIIESKHEKDEFVAGIFVRDKSDYRVILQLREFNQPAEYKTLRMKTFNSALNLIT